MFICLRELYKNVDPLKMLRFVRFFYTRTGGDGRGDVGVSLLIVFKGYRFVR